MTDRSVEVLYNAATIGVLHVRGSLTTFQFNDDYHECSPRPIVGQQFEESPRRVWRQSARVPAWFANVLPERGPLLDYLAQQLEFNPRNEGDVLLAVGSDLPGAVALGREVDSQGHHHDPVDALGPATINPTDSAASSVRFSVAGVQLKLSMMDTAGGFRLPGAGRLGDFLVKFPGTYPGMVRNEYAMMRWAALCGLDVPEIRLAQPSQVTLPEGLGRFDQSELYVVRRFDRALNSKVHIEDFNQVIGQWPEEKYRGCSSESLGRLIHSICGESDFWEYLRRLLFIVLIGNEDAHLKNWSLRYSDVRHARLAPAYDLVSTVVYDGLDRGLALKLGGSVEFGRIGLPQFERVAAKSGADETLVRGVLGDFVKVFEASGLQIREEQLLTDDFWRRLENHHASLRVLRTGG